MSDNTESPPVKENSSDVNQQVPPSSVQDRKHLIDTAVRFLKNPKVVPTPVENKKLFLLKKGLTESEVAEALKISGENISSVQETKPSENTINQAISVEVVKADVPKPSIWIRIVKWIRNLVVAGCLTYTTYKLFIRRILVKKGLIYKPRTPKPLTDDDSIKEVKNSLKSLKESVDSMTTMLKQLTSNKQSSSFTNEDNTTALKNEIQSIKNLLLSRDRFPSLPTITPIIPSWQLNAKSEKDQKDDSPAKTTTTDEKKSESNEEDEE